MWSYTPLEHPSTKTTRSTKRNVVSVTPFLPDSIDRNGVGSSRILYVSLMTPCYAPSMYGIFTYIYHRNPPNAGVYLYIPQSHGCYGILRTKIHLMNFRSFWDRWKNFTEELQYLRPERLTAGSPTNHPWKERKMIFQASMTVILCSMLIFKGISPFFKAASKLKWKKNVVYPGALARVKWH